MPNDPLTIDVFSLDQTRSVADGIGEAIEHFLPGSGDLDPPVVIALVGTLGAGKTTFSTFLCKKLGVRSDLLSSPTFSLQNVYPGLCTINHFDFYRLDSEDEVFEIGFEETVERPGLHLVEWAERFPVCLPENYLRIEITPIDKAARRIEIEPMGGDSEFFDRIKRSKLNRKR